MFKRNIIFGTLLGVIALTLCVYAGRRIWTRCAADFYYPFLNPMVRVEALAESGLLTTRSRLSLAKEVFALKKSNDALTLENASLEKYRAENAELRANLALPAAVGYRYVFAEVLTRDPARWLQTFRVNKGYEQGVVEGAAALVRRGPLKSGAPKLDDFAVIGRVGPVSRHSAIINTLAMDGCRLSVFLPKSGVNGLIDGGGRGPKGPWTMVRYLPRDAEYESGAEVRSSGLSPLTPAGLLVGTLDAAPDAGVRFVNQLYVETKVRPFADFERVKFVLILVPKP